MKRTALAGACSLLLTACLLMSGCGGRREVFVSLYDPVREEWRTAKEAEEVWEWEWYEGDVAEGTVCGRRFYAGREEVTSLVTPFVQGAYYAPDYLACGNNLHEECFPTDIGCYSLRFVVATDWENSRGDTYVNDKYEGTTLTVELDILGRLNLNGENLVPADELEREEGTGRYENVQPLRSSLKPFRATVEESGRYRFETADDVLHRDKRLWVNVLSDGEEFKYGGETFREGDENRALELDLRAGDVVTVQTGCIDEIVKSGEFILSVTKL